MAFTSNPRNAASSAPTRPPNSSTSFGGICRDLRIVEAALNEDPSWQVTKVRAGASFGLASGHIDFSRYADSAVIDDDPAVMLKPLLERVEQAVTSRGGAGLLLTVDELHAANTAELERLGNDLQHVQSIVFAGAALPTIDDQIFKSPGATFFSRLARFALEPLSISESLAALRPPFDEAGIGVDEVALTNFVDQTKGYPYLVQLFGYEIWHRLEEGDDITLAILNDAYEAARKQAIFRSRAGRAWLCRALGRGSGRGVDSGAARSRYV